MQRILKVTLYFSLFFLCFLSILPMPSMGADGNKNKPLTILADSAVMNRNLGVGTYTGHVKISQGTDELTAAKVIVYHNNKENKIEAAIATGNPTCFQRQQNKTQAPFHACAERIQFYPNKKYVILLGNVELHQGENHLSSSRVEYDMATDQVKTAGLNGQKTRITIHPDQSTELSR